MKTDPWEQNLRDAAARLKHDAPEGLAQRIACAVTGAARPERPSAVFGLPVIAFALAACAAAAFYVSHRPAPAAAPAIAAVSPAVSDGMAVMDDAPAPDAPGLLQEDPLEDEASSAYSDARSAVSFLADNFLPSTPDGADAASSTPKT